MNEHYRLIETRELPDISSIGYWYEHVKTGAQVVHFKNTDEDKVFCAAFKTPPTDSTGLPHIMEHSVLSGSKKYPVKDPFMELAKGSLVTFLNAGTYPDLTYYPVATYNHKDFLNLMEVYLDSVFFPLIYDRKESFLQEGWHYEMDSADYELKINGIVYSEMKGAYSDVGSVVYRSVQANAMPETCYANDSGGDPEVIPELTYENYLQFHRDYYHPSNSIIFFYGDMDIEPCFKLLNDDYLSKFEKKAVDGDVAWQKPFEAPKYNELEYSVLEGEDGEGKNHLNISYLTVPNTNSEDSLGFELLMDILFATEASPIKKAIMAAGLGEDVQGWRSITYRQILLSIGVKNSKYDCAKLAAVVNNELDKVVKDGLDAALVEAVVNKHEFALRESDFGYSKGVVYASGMLFSLRYGANPFDKFFGLKYLEQIKAKINNGYFEGLIKKYMLDNTHVLYTTARPKALLNQKKEDELKVKLAAYKQSLSDSEKQAIVDEGKRLEKFQNREDSEEDLKKIPRVELSDISEAAAMLPINPVSLNGLDLLYTEADTKGIVYADFVFETDAVAPEDVPYIGVLYNLLSKLDTKSRGYSALANELNSKLGGFTFDFKVKARSDGSFMSYIVLKTKALTKNTENLFALASEVVHTTLFSDKKRVLEVLNEVKSGLEEYMSYRGDEFVQMHTQAQLFAANKYYDLVKGFPFYLFLVELIDNYDSRFEALSGKLTELCARVINKSSFYMTLCCDRAQFNIVDVEMQVFARHIGDEEYDKPGFPFERKVEKVAFVNSSRVQYNGVAFDYNSRGGYNGAMDVLAGIISKEYLMNELRAKGGAYGFGAKFGRAGEFYMSSYRDPQLERTYEVFEGMADYIKSLALDGEAMKKFVLGSVNTKDRPLSVYRKHALAAERYFERVSPDDVQFERNEILGCSKEDVLAALNVLREAWNTKAVCSFGSESKITGSAMFDRVVKLPF